VGGIFHYRSYYANDGYLRLWSGLVLQKHRRYALAVSEFKKAIDLGCDGWRVSWYLAQAAEKIGAIALAEKAVREVIRAAPDFPQAYQMLRRLEHP